IGIALLAVGLAVMAQHLAGLFQQPDLGTPIGPLYLANDSYRFYWGIWAAGVLTALAGAMILWARGWPARMWNVEFGMRNNEQLNIPHSALRIPNSAMALLVGAILVADLWMFLFTFNPTSTPD